MPPQEECADLPVIAPTRSHLLLQGVYGDLPHHNNRLQLDEGLLDEMFWWHRWNCLAAQVAGWYTTPPGEVGHRFMAIMAA